MPRENERVEIVAQVFIDAASGRHEARVSDISVGGCYIDSIFSVKVGEAIRFELVHTDGQRLAFTGEVAYCFEGIGFGVRFTEITDEQKMFLEAIVRK